MRTATGLMEHIDLRADGRSATGGKHDIRRRGEGRPGGRPDVELKLPTPTTNLLGSDDGGNRRQAMLTEPPITS